MARRCARPACGEEPDATLWYDYRQRTCWLEDLATEVHPMAYDLCSPHANATVVPVGWELKDGRPPVPTLALRPYPAVEDESLAPDRGLGSLA